MLGAYFAYTAMMLRLASRDREIIDEAYGLLERLGLEAMAEQRAGVLSYGDKRLLEIAARTCCCSTSPTRVWRRSSSTRSVS
ncbi:hypothetical protein [Halomonas urmiana]|uniref:hypothetical protein n=1 Tax=Halomonas urmiana TaxID=490901 RepID=UPI00195CA403|nr:hypothetical protein [Halomonas urmiana]